MGRPYLVRPSWDKALCRDAIWTPSLPPLPGVLVSSEIFGEFDTLPPKIIAERLFQTFGPSIVVWVNRPFEERLESLYRQMLVNMGSQADMGLDNFKSRMKASFDAYGIGPYATASLEVLRVAFHRHQFRVVNFDLLKRDPQAFLDAYCSACEVSVPSVELPHLNKSREHVLPH